MKAIFAIAGAAALLVGGVANAAEVGTRWSTGSSVRHVTGGHASSVVTENGSFRTESAGFELNVSADDFELDGRGGILGGGGGGRRGGGFGLAAGQIGHDDLDVDGTLAVDGRVEAGFRQGTYGIKETQSYDFRGTEWGAFGEASTFAR